MLVDLLIGGLAVGGIAALLNHFIFKKNPASKINAWILTIIVFIITFTLFSIGTIARQEILAQKLGIRPSFTYPFDFVISFSLSWFFYGSLKKRPKNLTNNKKPIEKLKPLISYSDLKINDTIEISDSYYKMAYDELTIGKPDPALWAKAFANAEGNQDKAKGLYVKYRAEQLNDYEKKKLQPASKDANILNQSQTKNYEQNKGLIAIIGVVGLLGIILFASQLHQNRSTNLSENPPQTLKTDDYAIFKFQNKCKHPIAFAVSYKDIDGTWRTEGWWNVKQDEDIILTNQNNIRLKTDNTYWYFYAKTTDGSNMEWKGKYESELFGGTRLPMMEFRDADKEKDWSTTCD